MPGLAFLLMKWFWKIKDLFYSPNKALNDFNILAGQTIIDYGCGPGRYIQKASRLVGPEGRVYAVDIHEMAYACICKMAKRNKLHNVYPTKANRYFVPIQENKADLIYVLDVFHMVSQPDEFLNELHRLVKTEGTVILEDGHQKRSKTIDKVKNNGRWHIVSENKKHLNLKPRFKNA